MTSKCCYDDNAALSNPLSFFCPLFRTISRLIFHAPPSFPFFVPPHLVAATLHLTLWGRPPPPQKKRRRRRTGELNLSGSIVVNPFSFAFFPPPPGAFLYKKTFLLRGRRRGAKTQQSGKDRREKKEEARRNQLFGRPFPPLLLQK